MTLILHGIMDGGITDPECGGGVCYTRQLTGSNAQLLDS